MNDRNVQYARANSLRDEFDSLRQPIFVVSQEQGARDSSAEVVEAGNVDDEGMFYMYWYIYICIIYIYIYIYA